MTTKPQDKNLTKYPHRPSENDDLKDKAIEKSIDHERGFLPRENPESSNLSSNPAGVEGDWLAHEETQSKGKSDILDRNSTYTGRNPKRVKRDEVEQDKHPGMGWNKDWEQNREQSIENDEIEITLSEEDLQGQFNRIEEELSLSRLERDIIESAINELVNRTVEKEEIRINEEMKEAMANILVSTLLQEYKQIKE